MNTRTEKHKSAQISEIYQQKFFPKGSLLLIIAGLFFLGVTLNYPFKESLKSIIAKQLTSQSMCPLSFRGLDLSVLFPPRLRLKDTFISGTCFNQPGKGVRLSTAQATLRLPSLSPFGPKASIMAKSDLLNVKAFAALGLSDLAIRLKDSSLDARFIHPYINHMFNFQGKFKINGLFKLNRKKAFSFENLKLTSGNILLSSKNFSIPYQKIMIIRIPHIPAKTVSIKAKFDKKGKLKIIQGIIGDSSSPMRIKLSGFIKLNQKNIYKSKLNFKLNIQMAKDFVRQMTDFKFLLDQIKKKDGSYEAKIKGTVGRPIHPFKLPF